MLYTNVDMETFPLPPHGYVKQNCDVKITPHELTVSYRDGNRHIVYFGSAARPGLYKLICHELGGATATLHGVEEDGALLGSWSLPSESGTWRVTFAYDPPEGSY